MSLSAPTNVVVWGTGHVGRLALACVLDHPGLELAGVIVHSETKAGLDAGELCGRGKTGIIASTDAAGVLTAAAGTGPTALCYVATGDARPTEAAADMAMALRLGIDVVSTSVVSLVHPASAPDRALVAALEAACREGDASCFTSGIDPGVGNDLLPMTLLGLCSRVDQVRVTENLDYSTYDVAETLFDIFGFGGSLDDTPLILLPGVLSGTWGCAIQLMAEGLGVTVEEIVEHHERVAADRDITVCGRTVVAGTQAGMRFEVAGIVGGEPRIVVEHVTRLAADVAPDWPVIGDDPEHGGGYHIEIYGNPRMVMDLQITGEDGDHNTGGLVVSAMRLLAAIPAVQAAPAGLLTPLDIPVITGLGAMASHVR